MISSASIRRQQGATLVVGLIMLVLITLVVTSAFMLSTSNLRAVGNMQFRNEAIAAANAALEQKVSSNLSVPTAEDDIGIDVDGDGDNDYVVDIRMPTCIRASIAQLTPASSVSLGSVMASMQYWNTLWDIEAVVEDSATGAAVTIHHGVRVVLTNTQKQAVCA